MEDKVSAREIMLDKKAKAGFFAVYDGHGGDQASTMLQLNLHAALSHQAGFFADPGAAIVRAAHEMDYQILQAAAKVIDKKNTEVQAGKKKMGLLRTSRKAANEDNHLSGSTGAFVVVSKAPGAARATCHVCWVGDSRIVLSTDGGKARGVSEDHKASRADEKKRIRDAGGTVDRKDRLYGDLAVSRAFGDIYHKGDVEEGDPETFVKRIATELDVGDCMELQRGALICTPDIVAHTMVEEDEFFIIASDGVWDVLSNQEAVNFVRQMLVQGKGVGRAVKELVKFALHRGSIDNVSAVLVLLNQTFDA